MNRVTFEKKETAKKVATLANDRTKGILPEVRSWDTKTLFDIASEVLIERIDLVSSVNPKNNEKIFNLAIELEGKTLVFPLSKSITADMAILDSEEFSDCRFVISKKMIDGVDKPGSPNGPEYISFGKPSGLKLTVEKTLAGDAVTA